LEIARRNIIAASSLLDNKNGSPIAEYFSISNVYHPLNKLLNGLLPQLKFEGVDISDTDSPKCIFSKDNLSGQPTNQIELDKLIVHNAISESIRHFEGYIVVTAQMASFLDIIPELNSLCWLSKRLFLGLALTKYIAI
jgi:hypothetical protein